MTVIIFMKKYDDESNGEILEIFDKSLLTIDKLRETCKRLDEELNDEQIEFLFSGEDVDFGYKKYYLDKYEVR